MTAPIDRAFVEILPEFKRFAAETKTGINKSLEGVHQSVGNATKGIENGFSDASKHVTGSVHQMGAHTKEAVHGMQHEAEGAFHKIKESGHEAFNELGGKGLVGLFAVGGLIEFGHKSVETLETITKESMGLQRVMGGNIHEASEWRGIMELAGVSAGQFQISVKKMSGEMLKGANGKGAFAALGIEVKDAEGKMKGMGELLPEISDKFKSMAPGAQKNALAIQLFGRSGLTMLPFLNRGKEGMAKLGEEANKLGIVIGQKDVDAVKKSVAAQREHKAAMEGLQIIIGRYVLPVIDLFVESLTKYVIPSAKLMVANIALAVTAFISFGKWAYAARTPIMIIAGIITALLLPAILSFAVAQAISLGESITLWGMYKIEAIQGAISGVRAHTMTALGAARSAVTHTISFAVMIAGWIATGAQALLAAGRIALAWLISIGPIALVIAAVVGLVILIVKNWNTIWMWTQKIFRAVFEFLRDHWKLILAVVTGPIGLLVLYVATHFTQIRDTIVRLMRDVLNFIRGIPGAIAGFFANAINLLLGAGRSVINGFKNGLVAAWRLLWAWYVTIPTALINKFGQAQTWLIQKGKDILGGLWKGIKAVWNDVSGWFGSLPKKILGVLGIHSPPDWAVDAGGHIMKGILKGIVTHAGGALGFMGRWTKNAIGSVLSKVGGFFSQGTGANVGDWITQAMALTGVPFSWAGPLERRIAFESGGNPNAINLTDQNAMAGHPSIGLMQTIQSTFDSFKMAGHDNIRNPVDNLVAAIRYIQSRYGSIMAIDPPVQGYKEGAWNIERNKFAQVHKGEMIVPSAPAAELRKPPSGGRGAPDIATLINAFVTALSGMAIRFDGDGLARLVSDKQNIADVKGPRR